MEQADGSFHALLVNPGGTVLQKIGKGSYANALNDLGQVVGSLNGRAILYDKGTVQDLGPGVANGINNFGIIVGDGSGVTGGGLPDIGFRGFVYFPFVGMRNLQDLTPAIFAAHLDTTTAGPFEGYLITGAVGINDRGQIAANAYFWYLGDQAAHLRAVILTPHFSK